MDRRAAILSAFLLAALELVGPPRAAAQGDKEYQIKAACLYHFCRYVEWPKNAVAGDDKMFVIGVVGEDPFGGNLERVAQQMVGDKKIVVRKFKTIDNYEPCHILYVAPTGAGKDTVAQRLAKAQAKTKGTPVLIVADAEGLAQKGAVVNFFLDDNKVKFEINRDAEKRAGLKISSELLRLAKLVTDAPEK